LPLPEDNDALRALVQSLMCERDQHKQQAQEHKQQVDQHKREVEAQRRQTAQLEAELLRLQLELERYKKWYYGPRADRLRTAADLAQLLLHFAEELDQKPIPADAVEPQTEPEKGLRRVTWRKGRRDLARLENLPVSTHVYELSPAERACPGCGQQRHEIG
jgi:hypothetical protein